MAAMQEQQTLTLHVNDLCALLAVLFQRDNAAFNERLLAARRAAYEQQRAEARSELAAKMEWYRESTQEEHRAQQRHRDEMAEYMVYMDARREQQARQEREMERLIQEDVRREEDKRDAQWGGERQARERLMQQVYEGREQQLREIEQQKGREEEAKVSDAREAERDLRAARQAEADEERARQHGRSQRRSELRNQIAVNREKREFEASEREREKLAVAEEERQHQAKLAAFRQEKMDDLQKTYNLARR